MCIDILNTSYILVTYTHMPTQTHSHTNIYIHSAGPNVIRLFTSVIDECFNKLGSPLQLRNVCKWWADFSPIEDSPTDSCQTDSCPTDSCPIVL